MRRIRTYTYIFFISLTFLLCHIRSFAQQLTKEGRVERTNVTLHYKIFGNKGEHIIILGGGPGSVVDYMQPIADSLSKYYQCVMLEQRGTGRSTLKKYDSTTISMNFYVEDVEAVRKQLKAEKVILLGNSWGSLLSFLYGIKYPNHVSKIISLGSGVTSSQYATIFDDNFHMRLLPHEKEIRDMWKEKLKDPSTFIQANYERDKAGMPAYYYDRKIGLKAAMALKPGDFNYHVFPAFDKAHPQFDIRADLSKITASVLLVQGRQDLAPEAGIIETHQLIKGSILRFIERCGHIPWEEKPKETWEIIYKFLIIN